MGARLGTLILFVVILGAGVLLGSAVSQWLSVGEEGPVRAGAVAPEGTRIRVEVLNAGGRSGMARAATRRLRDAGFDVVYYGNAETFGTDSSVVLDRVGRLEWARSAADALGIRRVRTAPDTNLFVDVSVRLGPEWSPDPGARPEEGSEEGSVWARLRGGISDLARWVSGIVGRDPG